MKQITAILLIILITLSFSSCKTNPQTVNGVVSDTPVTETPKSTSKDLMSGITPKPPLTDTVVNGVALTDFAVDLFKACDTADENVLVSPLSVMAALAMTANGAEGETLSQMESVLGMTKTQLNENFAKYMEVLPSGEKYKLNLANAIWFTDDESFTVNEPFLQTNADYYGADIYKAPFDESTLADINNWVKEKTDDMIPNILDEIPYEAVMYLVNALAFEAEWQEIYSEWDIREGYFTTSTGAPRTVDFMHSDEYTYLEDDNATGFVKYYADKKYAFAALLPNEGVKISDYVSTLDGAAVNEMLSNAASTKVSTFIPKFEMEYSVDMSDVLESMGMPYAFDSSIADFSSLGTSTVGDIYIDRVLHKTFISVDEKGTMAGASTVVEMLAEGAVMEEPKIVRLDRPFVYMLFDCETKIPFFVGKVTDIKGTDTSAKDERTEVDYGARYIRTNGGYEHRKLPDTAIINSKTELFDYYENNKNTFNLERVDKVYSDTTIGFLDVCDEYDDTFFENNSLVFVVLAETSGSIRHEITDVSKVTRAGESNLDITVKRITPDEGTADMAAWHLIAEVPKSTVADTPEITLKFK